MYSCVCRYIYIYMSSVFRHRFFPSILRIRRRGGSQTVNWNSYTVGDFPFSHPRAARERVTAAIFGRIIDVYAELYRTVFQTRTRGLYMYISLSLSLYSIFMRVSQRRDCSEATVGGENNRAVERTSETKGRHDGSVRTALTCLHNFSLPS